jgi:hypothetical protein
MMSPKLDLLLIFRAAFSMPWQRRGPLLRAVGLPMIVLLAVVLVWEWVGGSEISNIAEWMLYCVYYALFVMVAVRCHRVFLMAERAVEAEWLPRWRWHDTHFTLLSIVIWIITIVIWIAVATLGFNFELTGALPDNTVLRQIEHLAWVPGLYLAARFVLVLPAAAIDRPISFGNAWALSQGNSLRLAIVAFGLPWVFSMLVSLLYKIDNGTFTTALGLLIANLLVIVEVAAISTAYRELATENTSSSG